MALNWTNGYNGYWYATGTSANDTVTMASEGGMLTNTNNLKLLAGNDIAYLDFGDDAAFGGSGNDTLFGSWGDDYLAGEDGNDILYGEDDDDKLSGGFGADALYGGQGNDTIDSGVADNEWDNLAGGNGHDTYVVWDARDVITSEAGWATGSSKDLIQLQAASFNMNANADTQAIENLTILNTDGAKVTGNMYANVITGGKGNDSVNGDAGNDSLVGGDGQDTLVGSVGDDTLVGEKGNDRLEGSNGLDKLYGGLGGDELYGGDQADWMNGGEAGDLLQGGAGNDTLYGDKDVADNSAGTDMLYGGTGNDNLYGGVESDYLYGGDGNDRMYGGAGQDYYYGGTGDDTYYLDSTNEQVAENAGQGYDMVITSATKATVNENVEAMFYQGAAVAVSFEGSDGANVLSINGSSGGTVSGRLGDDDLTGSAGNDTIYGGDGNDFMQGLSGNDTLDGYSGADEMRGGLGNDTYLYASAEDKIVEDANGGYDTVIAYGTSAKPSYTLSANVEAGVMNGDMIKVLIGNALDNTLTSSGYSGTTLRGMEGNDKLVGTEAWDNLEGGTGNDTLTGNGGEDVLNGGQGADVMQGGKGNDTYYVDNMADQVVESIFGNGIDTVKASTGGWTLAADVENLIYLGSGSFTGIGSDIANRIEGGTGSDTLKGMGGDDVLVSKGGADAMWGGSGADHFVFSNDNGVKNNAHIYDFAGGVDKIVLDADANWSSSYVDADTTKFTSATGGTVIVDGLDIGHVWNSLELV